MPAGRAGGCAVYAAQVCAQRGRTGKASANSISIHATCEKERDRFEQAGIRIRFVEKGFPLPELWALVEETVDVRRQIEHLQVRLGLANLTISSPPTCGMSKSAITKSTRAPASRRTIAAVPPAASITW